MEPPKLLVEVKGHPFHRDVPVRMTVLDTNVSGIAHVDGVMDVRIYQKRDKQRIFELVLTADATSEGVADRRHIRVDAHGRAHLTAQRRIIFDGKTFSGQPSTVQANFHACVDAIHAQRNGVLRFVTVRLARPLVKLNLPESDRIVTEIIQCKVAAAFDEESDKVIRILNKLNPISLFQSPGNFLRRDTPFQQLLYPQAD
jgi:hypothetical protein